MYKKIRELHEHIFKVWLQYCRCFFDYHQDKEEMPRIETMFEQIMLEYKVQRDKKKRQERKAQNGI